LMLHYPSLNIEWLITGKGRMYRSEADSSLPEDASAGLLSSTAEVPTIDKVKQTIVNQRKITSICVFFDDGTFQEIRV
ncbi:MAG: hypothetical protein LIQ26_00515, partial [Bacteroidota bacterium]|nr:hypothetical protein [Bacteroidota bacterium]